MAVSTAPATTPRRPGVRARRVGYLIAAAINGILLYLVNVTPGWENMSFLTEDFSRVVDILNLSLVVGAVVNLLWVAADPPWLRSLGQLVQAGISLVVTLRLLDVFPFDFSHWAFDVTLLVRVVLVVAAFGTAVGVMVETVRLARIVLGHRER